MKFKWLAHFCVAALALGPLLFLTAPAKTQQSQQVVDEVIAQVNDDIITLSQLRSASKRRIETLKKMGMTDQQAADEVGKHQDQLIAALINDQLLVQKGKELELSEKVEDEVNQRLRELAPDKGGPAQQKLLEETRVNLRTEMMKQAVFEKEVDSKLFFGFSLDELHQYFDTHKDKFRKLETVTLSEIFLSRTGKDAAQVKGKAERLVAQLRAGADFAKLAVANSERPEKDQQVVSSALTSGGKVGTFEVPTLIEAIAAAIRNLGVGAISDPIETADGYQILRVDARTPAGNTSVFNQDRVREAMTIELSPAAHEEYLRLLRAEAYIEIAKNYQGVAAAPR